MEKNRIWLWIGFLVVVLAMALLFFWPRKQGLNWFESYRPDSEQPYGTKVIHELLKDHAGNDRFFVVKDSLKDALGKWEGQPANYVFIGPGMWLDSLEEEQMLDFTEKGNTLFLSTNDLPIGLIRRLLPDDCVDTSGFDPNSIFGDSAVVAAFDNPSWKETSLPLSFFTPEGPSYYDWSYLDSMLFCSSFIESTQLLGALNGGAINYIRIPYGKGAVLLHTTPLAFTNFFLKKEDGLDYADKAFAYLNEGPVLWDRYSDYDSASLRNWGRRPPRTTRTLNSESPLQYILSQPPLAWAWYIGLGMALLYLLFRAKRRQRIIPILEPNTNTSMEFVATIGQLYFQQNNHRKLAIQKWRLFLAYIRDRYHLPTKDLDEHFIKKLSVRSGIAEDTLRPIFRLAGNIERSELFLSENTLFDLHRALDGFYRNCK